MSGREITYGQVSDLGSVKYQGIALNCMTGMNGCRPFYKMSSSDQFLSYRKDRLSNLAISKRGLNILAALLWYIGGAVLLLKGISLLCEADALRPGQNWPWLAAVAGLFLGSLKATLLFSRSCQHNLDRISALDGPRIWQFYSPKFFVLLSVMILVGATLSRLAHNNYFLLIGVAILDLSIAVALLGSSYVFWKQKAFIK